jgi:hypothetical protein
MALDFDGNDYISDAPCNGFPWDQTTWAVEFWFKLTADQAHSLISIYEGLSTTGLLVDFDNHNANKFTAIRFPGGAPGNMPSDTWTQDADWHHIALTLDGSNHYWFLDGSALGGGAISPGINEPAVHKFNLGVRNYNNGYIQHMNGALDEVRMWSMYRTPAQIRSNMYRRILPQTNLIWYFRLDEGAVNLGPGGKTAVDLSGNLNHGDDYGDPTYISGPPIQWNQGD